MHFKFKVTLKFPLNYPYVNNANRHSEFTRTHFREGDCFTSFLDTVLTDKLFSNNQAGDFFSDLL